MFKRKCVVKYVDGFGIEHAAKVEAESRREIVDWLKEKYLTVKILALHPPHQQVSIADYKATENGP
jgi:hypothetical protein